MVYDFGLMKQNMKALIDSFDHGVTIWSGDDKEYIADIKKHTQRWVELPVSPSCEQLSRVIFLMIERLLNLTSTKNGEKNVKLHSIIVHETATGYAQCFQEDAHSEKMGLIDLEEIVFSDEVMSGWDDRELFLKLLRGDEFINPDSV